MDRQIDQSLSKSERIEAAVKAVETYLMEADGEIATALSAQEGNWEPQSFDIPLTDEECREVARRSLFSFEGVRRLFPRP